jgi:hypothetical protein
MLVYSKKIVQFADEIKSAIRHILSKEIGLKVTNRYFLDRNELRYYPIDVVIYNHKRTLGYFDPEFSELGFHESLMHSTKAQLHNIIRHELAHYITHINYGHQPAPHGSEFKAFCLRMGWSEEVYRASVCLEEGNQAIEEEKSAVFRKVQKLMALAKSSNQNEAELAMIKSQQLLLKHNLESVSPHLDEGEKIYLKRLMKQKKISSKMRSIAKILETFFVSIVFRRADHFICLEILGNKVNLEIAEYVADVLEGEFDNLWNQAKKFHPSLKGVVAKNSFFHGIAKGYCNKIHSLKQGYEGNALMVIEKMLIDAKELVYPRLSSSKSSARGCANSSALGEQMGRQLNINPAVQSTSQNSPALIG